MSKTILLIFILILIIILGFSYYSNKIENLENIIEKKEIRSDTIYTKPKIKDSIISIISKKDGVLIPRIEYIHTESNNIIIKYDTIKEPFDTISFLVDYFSLKTYIDSLTNQDVEIKVFDTLQKNSIFAREYQVKNLRTEDFYKKRMVYIGGDIGLNKEQLFFGPSITYIDKSNNLFKGSYLLSNSNPTIMISYGKKLRLKK